MKSLLIHFAKDHGNGRWELAGRCCEAPILVGDELSAEARDDTRVRVVSIELYGRQIDSLPFGYIGNLFVQQIDPVQPLMKLVGSQPDSTTLP